MILRGFGLYLGIWGGFRLYLENLSEVLGPI